MAAVLAVACSTAWTFAADKVAVKDGDAEAKIQQALKLYKEGKAGDAIIALQDAIAIIQQSQSKGMAAFFPKAPDGWEAGKLETNSISSGAGSEAMTMTTLSQTFTRTSDKLDVKVTLTNSPQLIQPQKTMLDNLKNPQIMAAMNQDPDHKMKLIDRDGWAGWQSLTKNGSAEIAIFNNSNLLNINVDKNDEAVLNQFFSTFDLKGLAATATSKPAK
jgi:translation initiation factor 2 beta subunit (eIF-2beta)/eIF-5